MKQRYAKKTSANSKSITLMLFAVLLLSTIYISYAQVRVPFASRTNYTIKGDFTMMGNTNLKLAGFDYPTLEDNDFDVEYIDIDGDDNTWNSSSANLTLSEENGAIPSCSEIIYAGLYWTGRAFGSGETDTETFQVEKTITTGGTTTTVTKNFDKRQVSLKGPTASSYSDVRATGIYYPTNGSDMNMYAAFADVTSYVQQNGIGEYFVADIALREGSPDGTGYYGGWGMVIVYGNSNMKWRDITVFDGYAFLTGGGSSNQTINVSGLNPTQNGAVNLKLGIMAGEGDLSIPGDYFQIERRNTGVYESLSHTTNSVNNFFNASILTEGSRNPEYLNNTGLDIAMFEVDNGNNNADLSDDNQYITNNQTSTSFKYGTTQDAYIIYNISFSVDAYIPEIEGVLTNVSVNTAGPDPTVLLPGESAEYKVEIKNRGTEASNNTVITIPIPFASTYDDLSITYNGSDIFTPANAPYYDENIGDTGSIIWDLGTLPVPNSPDDVLADISFKLKATTDCELLVSPTCTPNISLNGTITGVGATSNSIFDQALIQGYETDGICTGEPIPTPLIINIDSEDYIEANCGSYIYLRDFSFCNIGSTPIPISQISDYFPNGTKYYNEYPLTTNTAEYSTSFPPTVGTTTYYAIPPGSTTCYYSFTINVSNITSVPTVQDVTYCLNETASALTATPSDDPTSPSLYTLYYYVDNDPSTPAQTSIIPSTTTAGETTYYVAEGYSNSCISETRVPIKVTVSGGTPEITAPATINIEGCDENNMTTLTTRYPFSSTQSADIKDTYVDTDYTATGNETIESITYIDVKTLDSSCPVIVTRTFTITNSCGSTATVEQIININDITAPTGTAPDGESDVDVCAPNAQSTYPFDATTVAANYSDNCGDAITVNLTNTTLTGDDCSWSLVYTFEVVDACGNKLENQTITHTGNDQTAPTGTAPTGVTDADVCADNAQTTYPFTATAVAANYTDNCGGTLTVNLLDTTQTGDDCSWSLVYTFEVVDACGNKLENQTITYTGNDQSAPIIDNTNLISNLEIECGVGDTQTTLTAWLNSNAGATATDNCGTVTWTNNYGSDTSVKCDNGPITVIFTATDACNNESTTTATYLIKDNVAPVITNTLGDLDATIECSDLNGLNTALALAPSATDDCSTPNLTLVSDETTNDINCPSAFVRVRTWNFTDACSNISSNFVQTITVVDSTAPELNLPVNVNAECSDDLSPIAFGFATATDNCDASPVITYEDVRQDGACSGTYKIIRTWTAVDACNNITTASQEISISDSTAPEFVETNLPSDLTVECNNIPVSETLTAIDNCGIATVTFNEQIEDGTCANNYKIIRTWTATDACGLTKTQIQNITVEDTTPPTFVEITLPTSNLVVECDAIPIAETLTATDICGSAIVTVSDVRTDGECANNYTLTRTWTATDLCGLTAVHTQTITVQDTKAPTFVGTLPPATLTAECDAIPTAETLTAIDNCGDASVTVQDVRTDGSCPNNYIITRTWTATDACGLTTNYTQMITVQDTKAPVVTSTYDEVLNVSCDNIPEIPELIFNDNCSSASNIIQVYTESSTFEDNVYNDYVIVRTWTVRDECDNEAIYNQTLNVTLNEIKTDLNADDWCFDEGPLNLNNLTTEGLNANGTWEILEGDPSATLNGSIFDATNILWTRDTALNGITYVFRYTTTNNGCISINDITMKVDYCKVLACNDTDVVISKAVTPNNDLTNDFFYITGIDLCGFVAEVKIFNRWGALIFESDNYPSVTEFETRSTPPANTWTGNVSKKSVGGATKAPNGTYYYIVTLKDSGLAPFTGPVYLGSK